MSLPTYEYRCMALQHTAAHCNTLQHTAAYCSILQHTTTHCNTDTTCRQRCWNITVSIHVQRCRNVTAYIYVQGHGTAAHCSILQHSAAHCSTRKSLQITATQKPVETILSCKMLAHVCVCIGICVYMHVCVYKFVYMHVLIRVYAHIYTQASGPQNPWKGPYLSRPIRLLSRTRRVWNSNVWDFHMPSPALQDHASLSTVGARAHTWSSTCDTPRATRNCFRGCCKWLQLIGSLPQHCWALCVCVCVCVEGVVQPPPSGPPSPSRHMQYSFVQFASRGACPPGAARSPSAAAVSGFWNVVRHNSQTAPTCFWVFLSATWHPALSPCAGLAALAARGFRGEKRMGGGTVSPKKSLPLPPWHCNLCPPSFHARVRQSLELVTGRVHSEWWCTHRCTCTHAQSRPNTGAMWSEAAFAFARNTFHTCSLIPVYVHTYKQETNIKYTCMLPVQSGLAERSRDTQRCPCTTHAATWLETLSRKCTSLQLCWWRLHTNTSTQTHTRAQTHIHKYLHTHGRTYRHIVIHIWAQILITRRCTCIEHPRTQGRAV